MDEKEATENSDGSKLEQIASTSTLNSKEKAIGEPEDVNKSLYLADLGFGKRIYNPKAMDGLAAFLKYNKIGKEIGSVFIEGGLIPNIPRHSGRKRNLNLTMLGNLATKKGKTEKEFYEMMISYKHVFDDENKKDKEKIKRDMKRYHNLVKQKIVNRAEASVFAKNELSKLVGSLNKDVVMHYQIDEDERENITEDVAVMISNLETQRKELGKNKKKLKKLIDEKLPMTAFNPVLSLEKKVFGYVKTNLNNLKNPDIKNKELQEYYQKLLDGGVCSKFFTGFTEDETDLIKSHVSDQTTKKQLEETYKNLEKKVINNINKIREFEIEKKELENNIKASNAILGSPGFYKVTKRGFTDAAIVEIVYGIVKEQSNEADYAAAPIKVRNILENKNNFHVSSSVEKIVQIKNKKDGQDTVYNPKISKISKDGIKILMNYNVNFMNSRVPTKNDIKLQIDDAHFRNKNKLPVPDIYLSANGIGGLRIILEQKYSENTIEGEERKTPEILAHIKLPTFHYLENLDYTKSKGIITNDTKRFAKKLYGGGAVIHTIKSNNVHEFEMVTIDQLVNFANIESEIKSKINYLKEKNLSRDESKKIRDEIKELKKSRTLYTKKIEVSGDVHIGCPNHPGRPSNYDFEIASQNYQKKNGLPDMLIGSEYLNGSKKKSFDSDKQNMSKNPTVFKRDLEEIMNDSSLNINEKIKKITKYTITDKNKTTLPRISQQAEVMKELVIPYFEEILKKGGKIVYVSGNHPNEDTNYDEAELIASLIPNSPKYIKNHQLELGKGAGESYGLETIRIDGDKTLFVSHKPKNGSDVIIGAMQQLLDANVKADIAVFFDRHHPGAGFADNTFYIAAAGKQPWNEYVTKIGKTPGLRGIVNFFHDPNKKGYGKFEFVLDPTLEREEYMQKI